jgi:RNA exonuclease 1
MESLNNLKHIPCPSGENCTVDHCLFQHQADRDRIAAETKKPLQQSKPQTPAARPLLKQGTRRKQDDGEYDGEYDSTDASTPRPQKRLKGEERLSNASPNTPTQTVELTHNATKSATGDQPTTPKMAMMHVQGVSPPDHLHDVMNARSGFGNNGLALSEPNTPLRNSPTVGLSGSMRSEPRNPSVVKRNTSSAKTPPTPTSAKARKAETLNPRLVHPPPVPHNTRHKIVVQLHQQLKRLNDELKRDANDDEAKLVLSQQELIWRALDEEEKCAKEKSAEAYRSAMGSRIMQLKKQSVGKWKEDREKETKAKQKLDPRQAMLGAPVEIATGLTSAEEVKLLDRLLTPIDTLVQHGYVASIPAEEEIQESRKAIEACDGWEQCDRCSKRFQVFPGRREEDGALTSTTVCVHHPGKMYFQPGKRPNDGIAAPKRYRCCNEAVGDSVGCARSDHHVFKAKDAKRLAGVLNFAKTPDTGKKRVDRAVCFDCEMGYTVHGLEVIRLTATSWPSGEELLDVLVKPKGEILDLNSRYSGVWPQDIATAGLWTNLEQPPPIPKTTGDGSEQKRKLMIVESPQAGRQLLFSLLTPDTPLIGHGLENDLNSIRIIHPAIIDTVLLFPHHRGLPYRNGLKMLAQQLLNKVIQVESWDKNAPLGHDSAEDARTAGELVRYKVKEEWMRMQRDGWSLVDGQFVPPGSSKPSTTVALKQ